jgi:uncharacterized protein (DUF1501 family)
MWTRREFVIGSATAGAACALSHAARAGEDAPAERAPAVGERVLVVVQLTGGNDGLNTIVPLQQDAYARLRPTLAIGPRRAVRLGDAFGLHPALSPLGALHADGKLAVVQGVGFPGPNRSHFQALEVWHTADPDRGAGEVGWLGRLADQLATDDAAAMPLVHIGAAPLPLSARANRAVPPSFESERAFRSGTSDPRFAAACAAIAAEPRTGDLGFVRDTARAAQTAMERLSLLASRSERAKYPRTALAQQLRLAARLIVGGFGTRVFALELSGFDTHSMQATRHAGLLRELGESLAAFERDLAAHGWSERVTTMVFSEFGRRAVENKSQGTDHGAGGPVLLVGGSVRGGMHGVAPDLDRLVDGDVPYSVDLRALYAALEARWLGLAPSSAFAPLEVVRA